MSYTKRIVDVSPASCRQVHPACVRIVSFDFRGECGVDYYVIDRSSPEAERDPELPRAHYSGPGGYFRQRPNLRHVGRRFLVYSQWSGYDI